MGGEKRAPYRWNWRCNDETPGRAPASAPRCDLVSEAPPSLHVEVVGELRVLLDGEPQPLPRSRKARALLAYLAVTGREHRRESLCDLLWDVADDRRAALRWSLSKLRQTLGPAGRERLVASRDHVALTLTAECLDLSRLRRASRAGFESLPIEELEALAAAQRGELLEGMLLPDFDAFEAWLEAERSEVQALCSRLSRALVERLAGDPERAFPHARAWLHRSGAAEAQRWIEALSRQLQGAGAPPPIVAPQVGEPASEAPSAPAAPLVGRERQLERLCLAAEEARSQRCGRLVLLLGEPGMGKTRLLEELRYRLREPRPWLLDGVFHEAERNRPLAPFLDATRDALAPPSSETVAPDRDELFEALAALVRRGADARGLGLLLLDDAHLCDPSSSELLHYVVRTAARSPLLTVLACRPAELEDNVELSRALAALRRRHALEQIELPPLDAEAMSALVTREGTSAPIDRILDDSAGNPLLALELARAERDGDEVPRTLSDLVLARVSALPEAASALVRWAAIFEHGPMSALQAASAAEVGDFVDAFETATRYRFVRLERSSDPSGAFAMVHALIRRVVYEAISPMRRAAMHRAAAEALDRDSVRADRTSLVAYHATRADRPDLAATALVRGAEHCATMGAVREATVLADRALALVQELDPETALALELDALLVLEQVRRPDPRGGFVERLTELGRRAMRMGRTNDARRAFHAASHMRWDAGDGTDGYAFAREAWQASRAGDAAQRIRGQSLLALCLVLMEKQLSEAQAIVEEAEALARLEDRGPEPAELALARGLLHLHAGRLDEARRDAADARTLARLARSSVRESTAIELTLQVELLAGRRAAVTAASAALAELATRIREGGEGSIALAAAALARAGIDDARPDLDRAVRQLRALDDKRRLAWVANRWAQRERAEGDPEEARRLAAIALEAALAVEAQSEAAMAACELMAAGAHDAGAYGHAEEILAELEATSTLSREARQLVEHVTAAPTGGQTEKGASGWSS